GEHKQVIGQAVEEGNDVWVHGFGFVETDDQAFSATAHGAGEVAEGNSGMAAEQNEGSERRQGGLHGVYLLLKKRGVVIVQVWYFDLDVTRLGSQLRTDHKEAILDQKQHLLSTGVGLLVAHNAHPGVQFIY